MKFNPATGKMEDDGQDSLGGSALLSGIAGAAGAINPLAGLAVSAAPALLSSGEPTPPATPAPPPPPAPVPPPPAEPPPAAPPAPPAAVPPPAATTPTLTKDSSTTTHSTSGTVVSPEMKAADKDVAAATDQGAKALELEAKNRAKQAEIDQAKLDVEAAQKRQEAKRAQEELAAAQKRKEAIDAQATRDLEAYRAEAAKPGGAPGFWGSQDTRNRTAWGISLLFGGLAHGAGAEDNPGRKLLDKTMDDWTAERDKKLARLQAQADKSGGLQRTFWRDFGEELRAKKELQDAAGYLQVADQIEAIGAKMKGLIPDKAAADSAKAAADYRQKAADKRQAVVDSRASKFEVKSTDVSSTSTGLTPQQAAQADKARAETLPDLQGNIVGKALSKEEGEKIRAGQASTNALVDVLGKLKAFNQQKGTTPGSAVLGKVGIETTDFKNRDTLMTQAAGYMTKMYETGVLNEGEYKRYVAILKPSLFQGAKGANESIDLIIDGSVNGYNRRLGSQLVKPGAQAAPAAPEGDIVEVRNRKTGQVVKARRGPDGQLHPVP